jgi:hypothetical protein
LDHRNEHAETKGNSANDVSEDEASDDDDEDVRRLEGDNKPQNDLGLF